MAKFTKASGAALDTLVEKYGTNNHKKLVEELKKLDSRWDYTTADIHNRIEYVKKQKEKKKKEKKEKKEKGKEPEKKKRKREEGSTFLILKWPSE